MKSILIIFAIALIAGVYCDDNSLTASDIEELKEAYSTQLESRAGFVSFNKAIIILTNIILLMKVQ